MNRKHTAWKKSRKFGDVHGGRRYAKITDNIFRRFHSLQRPSPLDELPIIIQDNPSRDFFFPISPEEVLMELKRLPAEDVEGITHLCFKRFKKADYEKGEIPLACFICGSGVRAVVLYPWPMDHCLRFGSKKPSVATLHMYSPYSKKLIQTPEGWLLEFESKALKRLYTELLLFHEVGHHIDWYSRRWTKSNRKQQEDFANQYAYERTSIRSRVNGEEQPG